MIAMHGVLPRLVVNKNRCFILNGLTNITSVYKLRLSAEKSSKKLKDH